MISKYFNVLLQLISIGVCLFLFKAYSDLLDFFPWGNSKSYVIWEPLVLYFIIPPYVFAGIFKVLITKPDVANSKLQIFLFLIVGLLISSPLAIGFDLEEDLNGRWIGVISSVVSLVLSIFALIENIKSFFSQQSLASDSSAIEENKGTPLKRNDEA